MTYSVLRSQSFAMKFAAAMVAVSILMSGGAARSQIREGVPPLACVSSAETRDLFVANKLVQPFRVMREASKAEQAEAIDIQLCRAQGLLVYDVTLLNRVGRVVHRLINASNGALLNPHPAK